MTNGTAPQVRSSQRAILLQITEEDGDQNYYYRVESHFSYPGGASGPTAGVGYDCGYSTAEQIKADWTGFVDDATVAALMRAAGITGAAAARWVSVHRHDITISWDQSLAQYKAHELPKWEAITAAHLPNTDLLSGDSFGALVSLTYNRGPSYDAPGNHYLEMREIKAAMAAKNFAAIPDFMLSMRRLWPNTQDLRDRRAHEALLFRDGLVPVTS